MNRWTKSALALLVLVCACGAEIRVGEKQGLKPVKGDAHVTLDEFMCGAPIQADGYTATSQQVGTDCRFTFDRDVVVATPADYDGIANFNNLVKAIELDVRSVTVTDEATGMALSFETQVKEFTLAINGQTILTKADVTMLPKAVRLDGNALDVLRSQIETRQTASVHVTANVTVGPPYPKRLAISYDVQPVLILGPH